jgi:hypothetical protein
MSDLKKLKREIDDLKREINNWKMGKSKSLINLSKYPSIDIVSGKATLLRPGEVIIIDNDKELGDLREKFRHVNGERVHLLVQDYPIVNEILATETEAETPVASNPQPPAKAELLLYWFLKKDEQEAIIGDLIERYPKIHARLGERLARRWFWGEMVHSLWPLIKRALLKAGGLVTLSEWIRRHISW